VVTPAPRWWAAWLRFEFAALALLKRLLRQRQPSRPVRRLSFIAFGRWAVVARVGGRRLPHSYILFQSNFNGAAPEYVEAFARGLTWRMRGLWGGAYGVPDPARTVDFIEYIGNHWVGCQHYYCAYPPASTKMILQALELREHIDDFAARAPGLEPDRFATEFADFVARVQRYL
jgi:hypothetical protein